MHPRRRPATPRVLARTALPLLALSLAGAPAASQERAPLTENPDHASYVRPPAEVERILRTDKNTAELSYASPDGSAFVVPHVNELSTLALMARPTYRLAELELRPATDRLWHLDTWGVDGVRIYRLDGRRFVDVPLPAGSFASDFTWSPGGARLAFLAHLPARTELWVADAATGRARSWSGDARILATLAAGPAGEAEGPSRMIQWTPEGTVLTLLVPAGRGPEPGEGAVPSGPVVRRTRGEPTSTRTFPNLLENEHDERLFEFYTTAQLAELAEGRRPRTLGVPAMWESLSLSPDGLHLLATRVERPFSYITSHRSFPRETVVLDREGREVASLAQTELDEGRGFGGEAGDGPRDFAWRPDGAGLSYLARAPRAEGARRGDARPDRVYRLAAPFDVPAGGAVVAESEDPIRRLTYDRDGRNAFATVTRDDETALARFDLTGARPAERRLLVPFHGDDPLEDPGDLLARESGNGIAWAVTTSDGAAAWLEGEGYRDDFRPRPFVDRLALDDGRTTRVFEGSADHWDRPLVALDRDLERMIVSRESKTDVPDSYVWTRGGGFGDNLTENVDPFPEITAAERIDFSFTRRDGLEVQGRVSMPVGWRPGDPPVPAMFWTYPREYEQAGEYEDDAVESRNRNRFTPMSWLRWSDIWLTQGYALVYPDIPIVGENYNDTYIASLVDAMYGAIRAVDSLGVVDVDRIGHGGHSYGAFATANILANAPFFRAGIAGDGAYNRSLTPTGFQAERRSIWEAPHTYVEMSPFFRADQIETPLLMYHGGDDNNTGTFPIQSRRMIQALTALGKTAVLYEYPFESHTPRAIENKLDMWARFIDWFDTYVKAEGAARTAADGEAGGA